jgi:hypothetical protein
MSLQTVAEVFGVAIPKAWRSKNIPVKVTNPDLMVGIELEIENLTRGYDWYVDRAGPFWSVVEDRSLRPHGQAWEFVSKPAAIGVTLAELALLFPRIEVTQERNYSDRCSVHIHTNVTDWTQEQVASLALVYPAFEQIIFQFVNHFKKVDEQGYCRDTNLYCIPWSDCRMNRNVVEKLFDAPSAVANRDGGSYVWQKYTALNLLPIAQHGTVEWRHMHGTCDMEKLGTWFNIIGAIMAYCKATPFNSIVETIKVMNDVSTYQQFFAEVLQGALPYKEEYRKLMFEGIVNAKYSLVNWEANKDKPKPKSLSAKTVLGVLRGEIEWDTDPLPAPEINAILDDWAVGDQRTAREAMEVPQAIPRPAWGQFRAGADLGRRDPIPRPALRPTGPRR